MRNISPTNDQRQQLLAEVSRRQREGLSYSQTEMALWAQHEFELEKAPNQSTISRLTRPNLQPSSRHDGPKINIHKRSRKGKVHKREEALYQWLQAQYVARRNVSGAMIQEVGSRLLRKANASVGEDRRIEMSFSNGWLARFKSRWGLKSYKSHRESGDADQNALDAAMPVVRARIRSYNLKDIFNADESGLYFRMARTKTIVIKQLMGRKKEKTRITFMPCANADGTEKVDLKIIGRARKPRAFQGKTGPELGFDYSHNAKAWMTSIIFFDWLIAFDQ